METSPPTKSLEFADISFATAPPVNTVPPEKGTPPMISELFDGTYKRPPKETSDPTKTRLLKLASPTRLDVPATYNREFMETSLDTKRRPFRLISSETIN